MRARVAKPLAATVGFADLATRRWIISRALAP